MDVKRRLPEWMQCMPAADHEKKKYRTRDSSNGDGVDETEVQKNFKPKDVNDGQVKKKRRIKDSNDGGENADEGLKKKTKTKYTKYGKNIDRKAVKKEIKSENVNNCASSSELNLSDTETGAKQHKRARDDEKALKQEVDEGTQKSWRKTSLEDYNGYLETKKHFGVSKNIDKAEPPPVRIHRTKAKCSVIEITDKNQMLQQTEDDEDSSEDEDLSVDDLLTIARELTGNEEASEALPPKPKTNPCLLGQDMLDLLLPPPSKNTQ